ncbi:MAG: DUF1800 family protein, partial [Leeuwenhoekiella sp.]
IIQTHGLGNFKTLVKEIGKSSSMLKYLNGFENTKDKPNENYARELFELFTLGVNNGYNQKDVENTARALTGYNKCEKDHSPIEFDPKTFDKSNKTIFGRTGNWDHDDVIDLLFEKRKKKIAHFIAAKFYRYFISPNEDANIIYHLSKTLIKKNWEMAPMLEQLLSSGHFFDNATMGSIIKSPFDLFGSFINETSFIYSSSELDVIDYVDYITKTLGQELLNPIGVEGWQGDRAWVDGSTIGARWQGMGRIATDMYNFRDDPFVDFAKTLTKNSKDPNKITRVIVDYFLCKPLDNKDAYETAVDVFKGGVPDNYYINKIWTLEWNTSAYQVLQLIRHIIRMPEFQLK